jgi:cytochrome c biogenesis protein CcdA
LALGLTYVASRFATYLALGFSLFSLGRFLNGGAFSALQSAIKAAVIAISALLCVLNIADFFNARRENYGAIKVQLPRALRRFNHSLINKAMSTDSRFLVLGIFFLGAAVSAGEFLCTGQIYLAAIVYMVRAGGGPLASAGLLCYTLAASIPPAALVILCFKGKQALALSEFTRRRMPLIKLANAALFGLFAVLAFFFF